ncbi:hypothetical protein ACS0TY_010781 [Phlomoides rotata]
MSSPDMSTLTASLERSLRNCSLNSTNGGGRAARGSDSRPATRTIELNSQAPLPYHWEQCLDLKSGEIYYINWRTGMRASEDPRTTAQYSGEYYSDDDSSSCESDGTSSPSSSRQTSYYYQEKNEIENNTTININFNSNSNNNNVLVVAGCKSCLMYYMVPKQLEICPKCCGQLLHFDRSENGSP